MQEEEPKMQELPKATDAHYTTVVQGTARATADGTEQSIQ
jgi:hypothetical protein